MFYSRFSPPPPPLLPDFFFFHIFFDINWSSILRRNFGVCQSCLLSNVGGSQPYKIIFANLTEFEFVQTILWRRRHRGAKGKTGRTSKPIVLAKPGLETFFENDLSWKMTPLFFFIVIDFCLIAGKWRLHFVARKPQTTPFPRYFAPTLPFRRELFTWPSLLGKTGNN